MPVPIFLCLAVITFQFSCWPEATGRKWLLKLSYRTGGCFLFLTVFSVVLWCVVFAADQTSNLESVCLTNDPPSKLPEELCSVETWWWEWDGSAATTWLLHRIRLQTTLHNEDKYLNPSYTKDQVLCPMCRANFETDIMCLVQDNFWPETCLGWRCQRDARLSNRHLFGIKRR